MKDDFRGLLFVVSGPSGVGKGAICADVLERSKAVLSVSMTTRAKRADEVEGKSYIFVSRERFEEIAEEDGFLEYTETYGDYYGTPKAPVMEALQKGRDVLLEIDIVGAMQIKEQMPDAVLIFIMPPSPAELKRRIERRGTETPEKIAQRLEIADSEIAQVGKYDYCVFNDELRIAVSNVLTVMTVERQFKTGIGLSVLEVFGMNEMRRIAHLKIGSDVDEIIERYKTGQTGRKGWGWKRGKSGGKNVTSPTD